MSNAPPSSIPHVVDVEILSGRAAPRDAVPDLLVEVPHGADRKSDYDTLRARMVGALPDDLHEFFFVNTDIGAYDYGRETARRIVSTAPERTVMILRCLIPRTFIDCNRPADFGGGQLDKGGLTAGIPAYLRDDADRELLLGLHRTYVETAERAYQLVCGDGGLALVPHTYGPRSLGIPSVGDDIVEQLRWACAPERVDEWPLRAEIDLLTRDPDGRSFAPPGVEDTLIAAFAEAQLVARANDTFNLHPASLAHGWSTRWPGQVLCLEVRRDLLVDEWRPLEEMQIRADRVQHMSDVIAPVVEASLRVQRDALRKGAAAR